MTPSCNQGVNARTAHNYLSSEVFYRLDVKERTLNIALDHVRDPS